MLDDQSSLNLSYDIIELIGEKFVGRKLLLSFQGKAEIKEKSKEEDKLIKIVAKNPDYRILLPT